LRKMRGGYGQQRNSTQICKYARRARRQFVTP